MSWPKGLPRKGFKTSGLSMNAWIIRHAKSVPEQPVPGKKVDVNGFYEYVGRKDLWARLIIEIWRDGECLVSQQWSPRKSPFEQAVQMAKEIKMPENVGYPQGKPSAVKWKKEPRATATQGNLATPDYATAQEGSSMGRSGTGGKSPGGTESSPALKGASLGDRNVKYNFNSDPDKPDTMPRRKG